MQKKEDGLKKKKRSRLPMHVYLGYLLVAALLFTGVTFSKYATSGSGGDEARVATFGELEIEEEDQKFFVTPGVDIERNPRVSFGVDQKSETAAYVFLCIKASKWEFDEEQNSYKAIIEDGEDKDKEIMSWSVDPGWKFADKTTWCQVFYRYVSPMGTLDQVPIIKNGTITVSPDIYRSDYEKIDLADEYISFQAYAMQANGADSAADATTAWAKLASSLQITENQAGEEDAQ